jgi:hypothetical protein
MLKGRKITGGNSTPIAPRKGTGDCSLKFENENEGEDDWREPELEDYPTYSTLRNRGVKRSAY